MFQDKLTNPEEHNPFDFIYIVHGINADITGISEIERKIRSMSDPSQFYRASMIAHLEGESAKRRIDWVGGEITHLGTIGNYGFIINPSEDNLVYVAWNSDLGSPNDPTDLSEYANKHKGKRKPPIDLLTQTTFSDHNELVIKGSEKSYIAGVFFKDQGDAKGYTKELCDVISRVARLNVPLIEIPHFPRQQYDTDSLSKQGRDMQSSLEVQQSLLEFHMPGLVKQRSLETHWERKVNRAAGIKITPSGKVCSY